MGAARTGSKAAWTALLAACHSSCRRCSSASIAGARRSPSTSVAWFRSPDLPGCQPGGARRLLGETVTHLEARVPPGCPKVAGLLLEAEPDLLAFYALPVAHHYLSEASMAELASTEPTPTGKELQVA
jgi:hypothetical protein